MSDHNYELYVEKKHARAEGHAEGHAEGLAEGRAEGLTEGKVEVARQLKAMGDSTEKIMAVSGLTEAEVLAL